MTYVYLYFAMPFVVAVAVLAQRLVQVHVSEPVSTVVMDRTAVVKSLLSKAAGGAQ